nr:hypothetical protein [Tanacetum cinerariifolium]
MVTRQKRTIQSDDALRQIALTNEEETALCKGWVYVSENSSVSNTRKDDGFGLRLQESGASDEDYYARALIDYEAETEITFKLRHCWEVLKGSPKWMQSEVPKFAAKSGGGSKRYKS